MVQLPRREESSSEFIMPEEGMYTIRLDRLSEERPSRFESKDGIYHLEQEFFFRITDDDEFDGFELKVFVRVDTFYDGSGAGQPAKVYQIAKALLGPEFDPDEPPDTEDLVGRKCIGTIAHKKIAGNDGGERTFANLVAYAPLRRSKATPARTIDQAAGKPLDVDDIPF